MDFAGARNNKWITILGVFAVMLLLGAVIAWLVHMRSLTAAQPVAAPGPGAAGVPAPASGDIKDYAATGWAIDRTLSSAILQSGFRIEGRSQAAVRQPIDPVGRSRIAGAGWIEHTITISPDGQGGAAVLKTEAALKTAALMRRIEQRLSSTMDGLVWGGLLASVDVTNSGSGVGSTISVALSGWVGGRIISFQSHRILVNYRSSLPGMPEIETRGAAAQRFIERFWRQKESDPPGVRPKLALVIDDWGYEWSAGDALLNAGIPLTIAVIPHLPASIDQAAAAHELGHEVIVHIPMEPLNSSLKLGKGALTTGMDEREVRETIDSDVSSVPYASGASNHMGSKATADRSLMSALLRELKARGMYFFDSNTSAESVAPEVARSIGLPYAVNRRFIDNVLEVPEIERQLRTLGEIAVSKGSAIGVGHVHPQTAEAILRTIPYFEEKGIQLVTLSQLVERHVPANTFSPVRKEWVGR